MKAIWTSFESLIMNRNTLQLDSRSFPQYWKIFFGFGRFSKSPVIYFRIAFVVFFIRYLIFLFLYFWSGSSPDYSMEVCYQLPVLPLDRPVPKHVLSRRGAISFSSSSSLFGAPDPRQLSQVNELNNPYTTLFLFFNHSVTMGLALGITQALKPAPFF